MRLLIVNADDFGLNDSATDGIFECYLAGGVTSTTFVVNAPASERAARLVGDHPAMPVGLHFNLTWGRPVAPPGDVPALLSGTGEFMPRARLARRLLLGRVPADQIRAELRAQLARLHALGVSPTHIDSHQHLHGFGVVFDAVATECETASIPMRVPWVGPVIRGGTARWMRRWLLSAMLARATRRWGGRVVWNEGLGSVFDLGSQPPLGDDSYRCVLEMARYRTFELMVHPVTSAAAMQGYTRIGEIAEAEWRYLRTGRLAAVAAEAGFTLGSYRDLA